MTSILSRLNKVFLVSGLPLHSSSKALSISYPDTWLKILGSLYMTHFVEVLGRDETIFVLLLQKFYYVEVLSGSLIALATWEVISRTVRYLDVSYDWISRTLPRLCLQIIFGVGMPALVVYMGTYLQFTFIVGQKMDDTTWLQYEFPVCLLLILLINAYYLVYYFYSLTRYGSALTGKAIPTGQEATSASRENSPTIPTKPKQKIVVCKGTKSFSLSIEDIAYFFKSGDYNYLRTFDEETYLVEYTLDELENQLDGAVFFRANRQTIIHFRACDYFSPIAHGKVQVTLKQKAAEPVMVSQKKAYAFKEWMNQ